MSSSSPARALLRSSAFSRLGSILSLGAPLPQPNQVGDEPPQAPCRSRYGPRTSLEGVTSPSPCESSDDSACSRSLLMQSPCQRAPRERPRVRRRLRPVAAPTTAPSRIRDGAEPSGLVGSTRARAANCRDSWASPRPERVPSPWAWKLPYPVSKEASMNHRGPWLRKQVGLCEVLALAAVLAFTSSSSARAEGERNSLAARLRSTLSFDASGGGVTSPFGGVTDPNRGSFELALHARFPLPVLSGLQLDYTARSGAGRSGVRTRVSARACPTGRSERRPSSVPAWTG